MSLFRFTITTPAAEQDPNTAAPAASRVWTPSTYQSGTDPESLVAALEGTGTTASVQVWTRGRASNDKWQKEGGALTVTAGAVLVAPLLDPGDELFLQVVGVSGSPTELHAGFGRTTSGGAAGAPGGTLTTPAAVTAGGAATALASAASPRGVTLQADLANTTNVRVGDSAVSATRGFQLAPGDSKYFPVDNASRVYHFAESGSPKLNVVVE